MERRTARPVIDYLQPATQARRWPRDRFVMWVAAIGLLSIFGLIALAWQMSVFFRVFPL
jgi:hypothetical protein